MVMYDRIGEDRGKGRVVRDREDREDREKKDCSLPSVKTPLNAFIYAYLYNKNE